MQLAPLSNERSVTHAESKQPGYLTTVQRIGLLRESSLRLESLRTISGLREIRLFTRGFTPRSNTAAFTFSKLCNLLSFKKLSNRRILLVIRKGRKNETRDRYLLVYLSVCPKI